jgi:Fe-S-cluster containining protein
VNRHDRRAQEAQVRKTKVASANDKLRRLVHNNEVFDRDYTALLKERGMEDQVSCKKGCAACCDQAIMMSLAEAHLILHKHGDLVRTKVQAILQHESQMLDLIDELKIDQQKISMFNADGSDDRQRLMDAWYRTRRPCVFLRTSDMQCSIYESRPLACRAHAVFTPPSECDKRPVPEEARHTVAVYDPGPEYGEAMSTNFTITEELTGGTVAAGFMTTMLLVGIQMQVRAKGG